MFLLDTCALLYLTLKPEKLSRKAGQLCKEIRDNGAYLSSISLWEIGIKWKNKKLDLGVSLDDYVSLVGKISGLEILPVDGRIWVDNVLLRWSHRDPADRTIVATALSRKLPIMTDDRLIGRFYKPIAW